MFIVRSNGEPIAVTTDFDHARIVAVQEKKDHPNHEVTYQGVPAGDMYALLEVIETEE